MNNYDVIIIGAGSIGVPTALSLGRAGVKTLVIDEHPSPGQGENKHAIGGVRATHSDPAKIISCLRSLEIFSGWEEENGDDIEWLKGGYVFPAYRSEEETAFKNLLQIQHKAGLNIDYVDAYTIGNIVKGINKKNLLGGTFSPDDGSCAPYLAMVAFHKKAAEYGVTFNFNEKAREIIREQDKVTGVKTDNGTYNAPVVIDAAGPYSTPLCKTANIDIPVIPDSHEAAITEPVEPFFSCMVVDMRPTEDSKNYYFYQNARGQIVFCITPLPLITGTDKRETSVFLPQVCKRMIDLIPRLKNIRVRRVWRGLYPMSPDGSPLVGKSMEVEGLIHATGMGGQGFMLGPGTGETVARLVTDSLTEKDKIILEGFSPYRSFSKQSLL